MDFKRHKPWIIATIMCSPVMILESCGGDSLAKVDLAGHRPVTQALDYDNAAPGRGYNVLTDEVHDFCLDDTKIMTIPGVDGKKVYFSLDLIEDTKTLAKHMSVSAAASINFGFSGGEGKEKFLSDSEINQTSVFALLSIRVRNAPKYVSNAKLSEDAAATLKYNPERFRKRCGDGFISSIITGAEYIGLIEVHTSNEREKQEVKAAVNANGMAWSAKAEFENAINSVVANKTVHIRTYQSGGDAKGGRPCLDVPCILAKADQILEISSTHPDLIDAKVLSYRTIALPDDAEMPIDVQNMQETETMIVEAKRDILDVRARWVDAFRNPLLVEAHDLASMQQHIEICERNIAALQMAASACYRDYQNCQMPKLEPVMATPPPRLNFSPPWPGTAPRWTVPMFDVPHDGSTRPCENGDILTNNFQASERVSWALDCNLIDQDRRHEFFGYAARGKIVAYDAFLYPTFSRVGPGSPVWVPRVQTLTSAAGRVVDCYVPPDVVWTGNCTVYKEATP